MSIAALAPQRMQHHDTSRRMSYSDNSAPQQQQQQHAYADEEQLEEYQQSQSSTHKSRLSDERELVHSANMQKCSSACIASSLLSDAGDAEMDDSHLYAESAQEQKEEQLTQVRTAGSNRAANQMRLNI